MLVVCSRDEHQTSKMKAGPPYFGLGQAVPGWSAAYEKYASISCGHKCNCVIVTNALFLLSCNCQRCCVVLVDSATVESGN